MTPNMKFRFFLKLHISREKLTCRQKTPRNDTLKAKDVSSICRIKK